MKNVAPKYFIKYLKEYDKNNKPAKVYLETKKNHDASFSCSKLFNELNIPLCDSVYKDGEQKFKGHQVPYTIIPIDEDRLALCLNLRDIPNNDYVEVDNNTEQLKKIINQSFADVFTQLDVFHSDMIENVENLG